MPERPRHHWRGLFAGSLPASVFPTHFITAAGALAPNAGDQIDRDEHHHDEEAIGDKRSKFDDTDSGSI